MTRWTIAQLRDKEKYDAWKDDDELIEVDEVDADKAKDKARIQELEEENEELRKDNASLEFILGQKEKEDNTLK